MSNIKNHFSTMLMSICSCLLSLLGFGCSSSEDPDYPVMYGTPYGEFEIKGSVTTEEGVPVDQAEIRVTHSDIPSGEYSITSASTNAEGDYIAIGKSYVGLYKIVCLPSDPQLEPDSVIVELNYNYNDKKGNNDFWYVGEAKEVVDFKLKPKSAEKE